jgi:hypothetical protein
MKEQTAVLSPRQKAAELVDKFCTYQPMSEDVTLVYDGFEASIQCAFIAVDEIIQSLRCAEPISDLGYAGYWYKVKIEIINLKQQEK